MRFGKLLKDAAHNPLFSISYRKGFWRSIDVLSRTSESLIFIDDVSPAASGGYCDYEDLAVWGEVRAVRVGCGIRAVGVSWVFIILREMSHKHSWTSWLTEASNSARIYQQHNPQKLQTIGWHMFEIGAWGVPAELCASSACWWWTLIYINSF